MVRDVRDLDGFMDWAMAEITFHSLPSREANFHNVAKLFRVYQKFDHKDAVELMPQGRFKRRWIAFAEARGAYPARSGRSKWAGFDCSGFDGVRENPPPRIRAAATRPAKAMAPVPAPPTSMISEDYSLLEVMPDLVTLSDGERVTAWIRSALIFGVFWNNGVLERPCRTSRRQTPLPRFTPFQVYELYAAALREHGVVPVTEASFNMLWSYRTKPMGWRARLVKGQKFWTGFDVRHGAARCGHVNIRRLTFKSPKAGAAFWMSNYVLQADAKHYRPNIETQHSQTDIYTAYSLYCRVMAVPALRADIFAEQWQAWTYKQDISQTYAKPKRGGAEVLHDQDINVLLPYEAYAP